MTRREKPFEAVNINKQRRKDVGGDQLELFVSSSPRLWFDLTNEPRMTRNNRISRFARWQETGTCMMDHLLVAWKRLIILFLISVFFLLFVLCHFLGDKKKKIAIEETGKVANELESCEVYNFDLDRDNWVMDAKWIVQLILFEPTLTSSDSLKKIYDRTAIKKFLNRLLGFGTKNLWKMFDCLHFVALVTQFNRTSSYFW